ncbi:MAG: DUF6159 family protein [Thermoplasmata archaeon]
MGRISRGWELTKLSFRVLSKDKELLVLPLISLILNAVLWIFLIVTIVFMPWLFFESLGLVLTIILFFVLYLISFFIATFFQAAVVGAAMIRLRGGDPTPSDGIRAARKVAGKLFLWSLISATIGVILRSLARRAGLFGRLIFGFVMFGWVVATYFVIPVIVFENLKPWKALKRSIHILKGAWGEALVGNLGLGLILFLLAIGGLVPIILVAILTKSLLAVGVTFLVVLIYWFLLFLIGSAAQSILLTALYRYGVEGKVSEEFPQSYLVNPWR